MQNICPHRRLIASVTLRAAEMMGFARRNIACALVACGTGFAVCAPATAAEPPQKSGSPPEANASQPSSPSVPQPSHPAPASTADGQPTDQSTSPSIRPGASLGALPGVSHSVQDGVASAAPGAAHPAAPAAKSGAAARIVSVFGQTAWQPPASLPSSAPTSPAPTGPAPITGGVPVAAPSSLAEASLRVSTVHLLGLIDHAVDGATKGSEHVEVGHVVDVLTDDKGDAAAVVIEISGFMGVGDRHIALATDLITVPTDLKGALRTALTPAQLRSAPTYDAKPGVVTVVSGAESPPGAQDHADEHIAATPPPLQAGDNGGTAPQADPQAPAAAAPAAVNTAPQSAAPMPAAAYQPNGAGGVKIPAEPPPAPPAHKGEAD